MGNLASTLGILFVMFLSIGALVPMGNRITDARSDPASDSLSCSTGASESECTLTLDEAHLFSEGNHNLAVTETSPGSEVRTDESSMSGDNTTVVVTGLAESTSYDFTVSYLARKEVMDANSGLDGLMERTPQLVVIFAVLCGGIAFMMVAMKNN